MPTDYHLINASVHWPESRKLQDRSEGSQSEYGNSEKEPKECYLYTIKLRQHRTWAKTILL